MRTVSALLAASVLLGTTTAWAQETATKRKPSGEEGWYIPPPLERRSAAMMYTGGAMMGVGLYGVTFGAAFFRAFGDAAPYALGGSVGLFLTGIPLLTIGSEKVVPKKPGVTTSVVLGPRLLAVAIDY